MKSVLISIQPYWVFLIIAKKMGWDIEEEKTVEVRKNYPKDENWNKVAQIYCSKNSKSFNKIPEKFRPFMKPFLGKVIGEFVCDEITKAEVGSYYKLPMNKTQIDALDLMEYANDESLYGWHIANLKIYDKPQNLSDFMKVCKFDSPCIICGFHFPDTPLMEAHCKNSERYFTRPPQNWCYTEPMLK